MTHMMKVANNIASSPPSGGTITHHGTPSTLPTLMSPEGGNGCAGTDSRIPQLSLTASGNAPANLAARRDHAVPPINTTVDVTPTRPHVPVTRSSSTLYGQFTVDGLALRAFIVTGLHTQTPGLYETIANCYRNFSSLAHVDASRLMDQGTFSVEFFDYNDAHCALQLTRTLFYGQDIACYPMWPKDIAAKCGTNPYTTTNHVGEFLLSLCDIGVPTSAYTLDDLIQTCQDADSVPRQVKAVQIVQALPGTVATFRVEWSDSRTKAMALFARGFKGHLISIAPFTPDIDFRCSAEGVHGRTPDQARDRANHIRSIEAFLQPRPLPLPKSPSAGAHNVVNIDKIRYGQDVRTTIMLRNIPNRVDQATLKRVLDETSHGKYDFMYLRIDFANNCNVGYAFINFVDPMSIVPFHEARAGKKWNLFQSEKTAEISYATIQGRDCLVQKFRNSSVMLEQASFRPKLYRTGSGPDAGTEEPFPAYDNKAKLQRSCDNAETVGLYHPATSSALIPTRGALHHVAPPRNQAVGGVYTVPAQNRGVFRQTPPTSLYAPREGQAHRERQRRQGSQYDRGTPGAEFERYYTTINGRSVSVRASTQPAITHPACDENLSYQFQRLGMH